MRKEIGEVKIKIEMDEDRNVVLLMEDDFGGEYPIKFQYPKKKYSRFNSKIANFVYDRINLADRRMKHYEKTGGLRALQDVEEGKFVRIADCNWVVLDHSVKDTSGEIGTLLIMYDEWRGGFFDSSSNAPVGQSNWLHSSQRVVINTVLRKKIEKKIGSDILMMMERDLISDDGVHGHGKCADLVTIISKAEFNKYKDLIPFYDGCWWTLTPHYEDPKNSPYSKEYTELNDSCCTIRSDWKNDHMYASDFGDCYGCAENFPMILLPNDYRVQSINKPEKRDYAWLHM